MPSPLRVRLTSCEFSLRTAFFFGSGSGYAAGWSPSESVATPCIFARAEGSIRTLRICEVFDKLCYRLTERKLLSLRDAVSGGCKA